MNKSKIICRDEDQFFLVVARLNSLNILFVADFNTLDVTLTGGN